MKSPIMTSYIFFILETNLNFPRASASDVAVNTIPMISAGIPGKHVIGYWAKRNNEHIMIHCLDDLQQNDLILGAMTQVGRKGPEGDF